MILDWIRKPKFLSFYIVIINAVLFGWIYMNDPSLSTQTLIQFGAKVNYLIADGDYWRLITPIFLHADGMHLVFNAMALLSFGPEIEMIFGRKKFLIIYLISGLAGSLGSLLFSSSVSVGASGAIFGLIGGNIYLFTLDSKRYKAIYGNQILVILAINIVYGFMNPMIDDSAHIAGFVGGFITAWATGYGLQTSYDWRNRVAQLILPILLIGSLSAGLHSAASSSDYYLQKGASLLNAGQVLDAKAVFQEGARRYPSNNDFKNILNQIDAFLKEMEKVNAN